MATVIHNRPIVVETEAASLGFLLGILALALFVVLFFAYALPAVQNTQAPAEPSAPLNTGLDIDAELPSDASAGPAASGLTPYSYPVYES